MDYNITNGETLVAPTSGNYTYLGGVPGSFELTADTGVTANLFVGVLVDATLLADGGTIDDAGLVGIGSQTTASISNGGSLITGGVLLGSSTDVAFGSGGGQLQLGFGAANVDFSQLLNQIDVTTFGAGDSVLIDGLIASPHDLLGVGWETTSLASTMNPDGTTRETLSFKDSLGLTIDKFTINNVAQGEHIVALPEGSIDILGNYTNTIIECVCFLPGTHIATAEGERQVEDLRPGDLVRTAAGAIATVKWVGHRTVDTRSLRRPELAMPVRITAGAIAEGVPQRDLRVTPEHAVVVDGHLIPARLLVNGSTIRLDHVGTYTFYHVELEQHDILLAEGLGAESYLDTGNRGLFANNGVVELFAQATEITAEAYNARACMHLTLDAATTGAVWQALAARAEALGAATSLPLTTRETALTVDVGGRRLQPVYNDGRRVAFTLPAGAAGVTLASRAAMPWSLHPWLDDRRQLGVAVDRIVLRSFDGVQEIALDSPAVGTGWWHAEMAGDRRFRWTDGAAQIALPPVDGPSMLELSLHATATYALAAPTAGMDDLPIARAG